MRIVKFNNKEYEVISVIDAGKLITCKECPNGNGKQRNILTNTVTSRPLCIWCEKNLGEYEYPNPK